MANYNIVVDTSNFKPMSYSDMIAPLLLYNKNYDAMEEKASKYIDDYGNLNLPQDSEVGKRYQQYMGQLNDAMQNFYDTGMTNGAPQELRRLFAVNKGDITKIKQAATDYQKYKEKVDTLTANGDAIVGKISNIDNFYRGDNEQIHAMSKKDIIAGATNMFAGLDALLAREYGDTTTLNDIQNKMQYYMYTHQGISKDKAIEEVLKPLAESNNPAASMILKQMRMYYDSLGIDPKHYDSNAQQQIWNNIGVGLISSIKDNSQIIENKSVPWDFERQRIAIEKTRAENDNSNANGYYFDQFYNEPYSKELDDVKIRNNNHKNGSWPEDRYIVKYYDGGDSARRANVNTPVDVAEWNYTKGIWVIKHYNKQGYLSKGLKYRPREGRDDNTGNSANNTNSTGTGTQNNGSINKTPGAARAGADKAPPASNNPSSSGYRKNSYKPGDIGREIEQEQKEAAAKEKATAKKKPTSVTPTTTKVVNNPKKSTTTNNKTGNNTYTTVGVTNRKVSIEEDNSDKSAEDIIVGI